MLNRLEQAIQNTRSHLLGLRQADGHWEGELASSSLATATAVVALTLVDAESHAQVIHNGATWLIRHQNADGGWGDTTISKSNLSTTLLCWSAMHLLARERALECPDASDNRPPLPGIGSAIQRSNEWIKSQVGSLETHAIRQAVIARYGKDKTFSVPILMLCTICGTLGEKGWKRVLPLPFELAALPRDWFGAIGLPVVSYALPALIAIGYARHYHAPFAWWNPLRWLKAALWPRISPMLKTVQPSTGGYLEATPLTSFVTMALASAGEKHHPCIPEAVRFLLASQRPDGSWPIDTNLATWGTTLSIKALCHDEGYQWPHSDHGSLNKPYLKKWLLDQQYKTVHPFTNAAPGGWAWTNLPGGVPDADDTSGGLLALWKLCDSHAERQEAMPAAARAVQWLLDLQNRDGGVPTFCRGWGTLPFDRSTPEITAHALWAILTWKTVLPAEMQKAVQRFTETALKYLTNCKEEHQDSVCWIPLWFGNEHTADEENRVYGTAHVVKALILSGLVETNTLARQLVEDGSAFLIQNQLTSGAWGGNDESPSIEETAVTLETLASLLPLLNEAEHLKLRLRDALHKGTLWLLSATEEGRVFHSAPIGLYFARLWYHEQLYPVIWSLAALRAVWVSETEITKKLFS